MAKKSQKQHKKKRSFIARMFRFFGLCIVWFIGISLFFTILYKFVNPPLTPLMVTRFRQQVFDSDRNINFERDYVSIDEISPNLANAVVASEDGNFMRHSGIDFKQLEQSYKENQRKGKHRIRGGSTISMQTAKNAFLPHHRNYVRKAFEAYFTKLIEWTWGKKRIMEVYLNIIEFGDGIYGCEAASQHYFHKPASKLTRREAAALAVTLPAPMKRNPSVRNSFARRQTGVIQNRMWRVNLDKKLPEKGHKKRR